MKINVGLIGFGLSGKFFHLPLLLAHGQFNISKILTSRIHEVEKAVPKALAVQDIDQILNDKTIDLVINTAPNNFHYSYTKAALRANKHVVVEKPFVINSHEGEELIELAKSQNKLLTVYQNRRLDSDFLTIKKLLESQTLGEIKQFESHFDRFRPHLDLSKWRESNELGSGVLYDLGSHLIDQSICLFGSPDSIFADIEKQRDGHADDYFHLVLSYKKMRVILHSSSLSEISPRFQLYGTKGSFVKYGQDPQEKKLKQSISPLDQNFGQEKSGDKGVLTTYDSNVIPKSSGIDSERGNYLGFYINLYNAISKNEQLLIQPEVTLTTIKIIELCFKSSREKRVITL